MRSVVPRPIGNIQVVATEQRREAVRYLQTQHGVSERRALRTLGFGRSSHRYQVRKDDQKLGKRLQELAEERPRFGYRRLHVLLRREGETVNHKRVWRVYKAPLLSVRKKTRRKRTVQRRMPPAVPSKPNERWSMDFVSDQLANGQRFRVLNVVDDFTRECLVCFADTSITGAAVARLLGEAVKVRGKPKAIVSDNGPEFTSRALDAWAHQEGIGRHFIDPGKPVQNAFIESQGGRFRDECLNQHWFPNLPQARLIFVVWQRDQGGVRPHSSLDNLTPQEFARRSAG